MSETSQIFQLPNTESAIALAGVKEANLDLISRHTGVKVVLRGQELLIFGQLNFEFKRLGERPNRFFVYTSIF